MLQGGSEVPLASPLISRVEQVCTRLAPLGWKQIFRRQGIDILAENLAAELAKPLTNVDRSQAGFTDFAPGGVRGIEPSVPSHSLLFHGLASPLGRTLLRESFPPLQGYPTERELLTVLDYVFAVDPPTVEDLRAKAHEAPLAVVAFAFEYRAAVDTVHRKHADLCFSRTGVARAGTRPANFVETLGAYTADDENGHEVAVLPCRYGAFVAAALPGAPGLHGPADFISNDHERVTFGSQTSDSDRRFWVPVHKLFSGPECIRGLNLDVRLSSHHVNEKIRRVHLFFGAAAHDGGWHGQVLNEPPFRFEEGIAELGDEAVVGGGLLMPTPHESLVEPAVLNEEPLWFNVPATVGETSPWGLKASSLNLKALPNDARTAPEYVHARHLYRPDQPYESLNDSRDVVERVRAGGYRALHYVDYTGDGWIDVACPELAMDIPVAKAAYSLVGPPDFFPLIRQSDLTRWTDQAASEELRTRIWPPVPGRPEPLSAHRLAPNLTLTRARFDDHDDTMTAIVGLAGSGHGPQSAIAVPIPPRVSTLPDGAAGVFGPGWDASIDRTLERVNGQFGRDAESGVTFLANYGLGSPFPEDSMLCSAYSSFWPAVVPDITRTFAPSPKYATATPLLDETIGIGPSDPWDGIPPLSVQFENGVPAAVSYVSIDYGDYVERTLDRSFDFSAVTGMTATEYLARTVTTASVYKALRLEEIGPRTKWSMLSFRRASPDEPGLQDWLESSNVALQWQWAFRFEMIRHDGQREASTILFDRIDVPVLEHAVFCADPNVIARLNDGVWTTCELHD